MSTQKILLLIAIVLGLLLALYPAVYTLGAGLTILFLVTLLYATFNPTENGRARWIFMAVFVLLAGVIGVSLLNLLQRNQPPDGLWIAFLQQIFALAGGAVLAALLTTIFALITIYVAGVYVLSIQTAEGITVWQAFRSLLSLILNIQYDWIVVSGGQVTTTRPGGVMKELGGPGKVIVDPGNAVVLQRGGKITQVCGPGVWMTKRNEKIREIFDLRPQFELKTVENVLTRDHIPLNIVVGIGYRLTPADKGHGDVIADNENAYAVNRGTLIKAAANNTAAGWRGLGGGAPVAQLHDQIMQRTFDELFRATPGADPDPREIRRIEQAILTACNGFGPNNGVTFTGIDIRQITPPPELVEAMMLEIKSDAEARSIRRITEERNRAQHELIDEILAIIAKYKVEPLDETDIQLATVFVQLGRRGLTDDVLGHQYIDMLKKLAEGQGAKIFSPPNMPFELKELM